jgi:hypothetical protein
MLALKLSSPHAISSTYCRHLWPGIALVNNHVINEYCSGLCNILLFNEAHLPQVKYLSEIVAEDSQPHILLSYFPSLLPNFIVEWHSSLHNMCSHFPEQSQMDVLYRAFFSSDRFDLFFQAMLHCSFHVNVGISQCFNIMGVPMR